MSYRTANVSRLRTAIRLVRFVARHPVVFAFAGAAAAVLIGGLLAHERREDRIGERRMEMRAEMATRFVQSYVRELAAGQRDAARTYFSAGSVSRHEFADVVKGHRYRIALLLDSDGRVRSALPADPGLVGRDLTGGYQHIRDALRGRSAVSNVVTSAVRDVPVVAIATPFRTTAGRQVFSTAYELSASPLTSYLAVAMPTMSHQLHLVDDNGIVVASERRESEIAPLSERDPELAAALRGASSGVLSGGSEPRYFIQRRVEGTPWRFVATVPLEAVHTSTGVGGRLVRLAGVGALIVALLLSAGLFARLVEARTRLLRDLERRREIEAELVRERRQLVAERRRLAYMARHDSLTDLPNRSVLFDRLERSERRRDGCHSTGILFIDLDRFKQVNDDFGHEAGDRVLQEVARRLRDCVRPNDTVARLGGDEFAVLCESLEGEDAAEAIAQRIRDSVERPIDVAPGRSVTVGASIGMAQGGDAEAEPGTLLAAADADMYEAKRERTARFRACALPLSESGPGA